MFTQDATLEQKLEITRQHLSLPGAVVAVYEGDNKIIDQAFGVADLDTNESMTTDHHFRIASIAKPFVSTVLLQLADDGRVSLDDPISKYLEGVPSGENITLEMLAQHTSGLNNFIAHPETKQAFAAEPKRQWTETELLNFAYKKGPYFDPVKGGWMYANTNYVLLGQLIEKIEGKPLDAVIQNRICKPLGLKSTYYSITPELREPFAKGYQYGDETGPIFWKGVGNIPYDVTDTSPSMWHAAGAMVSTLDDVRRFAKAVTTGELISDEMFARMTTWRDAGYPVPYWYGLGLIKYYDAFGHNGNVPGYQVTMMHQAEHDRTVVVLANMYSSPNYEEPANAMFFVIMRHLTGKSYAPPGWKGW